jgi:hypothetical protein
MSKYRRIRYEDRCQIYAPQDSRRRLKTPSSYHPFQRPGFPKGSTGADDFFVQASHKSRQVRDQFVRQLTFDPKLIPNRRLHLET